MYKSEQDFFGVYRDVLLGYVQYKRSLGFDVGWRSIYNLLYLNHFLDSYHTDHIVLTKQMAESFVLRKENASSKFVHINECIIRQFGIYLQNQGFSDIFIYPENHVRVTTDFVPYIFTVDEINRILTAADQLKERSQAPHFPIFFQTLLRVLYCTGLRINEALGLRIEDVDFKNNLFIVLNGKGNVSRMVPFHDSLKIWLERYWLEVCKEQYTLFFESPRKGKRERGAVTKIFQEKILPSAGINRKPDNTGPRIHDLRYPNQNKIQTFS